MSGLLYILYIYQRITYHVAYQAGLIYICDIFTGLLHIVRKHLNTYFFHHYVKEVFDLKLIAIELSSKTTLTKYKMKVDFLQLACIKLYNLSMYLTGLLGII